MSTLPGASNLFTKQGMDLTISHVPTGFQIAFPAFLDLMSDAYTCDWDEQSVFGRMDNIPTFRSTRRALSLAWHMPAESFEDSMRNVEKVNKLISFLYPLYDKQKGEGNNSAVGGATAINQSPLVRVSFGNLIQNAVDGRGLLGYLSGITFDPALEYGMFTRKGGATPGRTVGRTLRNRSFTDDRRRQLDTAKGATASPQDILQEYYPKTFRLNFELTVLHEHELGFKHVKNNLGQYQHLDRDVNFQNFPYASPVGGVVGKVAQDANMIKSKYTKLRDRDPGLPATIVDLSSQIEGEGATVLRQAAAADDTKRKRHQEEMDDANDAGF